MELLQQINGALLEKLSGGSTAPSAPSTVGGRGQGASFDGGSINVTAGLNVATQAFTDSYLRLNTVIASFQVTRSRLGDLRATVSELRSLAERAAHSDISEGERSVLHTRFQDLVTEFGRIQEEAQTSGETETDFLDTDDLEKILRDGGIDLTAATKLAAEFAALGGADTLVGFERVLSEEVRVERTVGAETIVEVATAPSSKINPLEQSLSTEAGARRAAADLAKLEAAMDADIEQLDTVFDELRGAYSFAKVGTTVFDEAAQGEFGSTDPDALASLIVQEIRLRSRDSAVGLHSSLDRTLARDLLAS